MRQGCHYTVAGTLNVDTRADPEAAAELMAHWSRVALARYGRGDGDDLFAYNALSVSNEDLERIRGLQFAHVETDHPVGVVIWFHLVAVPVTGGWTAFTWVPPVGTEWLLALAVGLLSVVAQVAMTFALHQGEANVIMPFKYFGAVLAFIFGLLLFDEHLNQWALAGIGLVILSVTINTVLKRRWEHKPSP